MVLLTSLSSGEKERILKAIEEDREFRYALMGLLGFKEVLDRITRLEEDFKNLAERQQRLEERFARLEERQQRLEERQQRLEERFARLEERFARLEERQQGLEERQSRLEKEMVETRRVLMVIAHRFGVISEESFREGVKYVVEEVFGVAKVSKWRHHDADGIVYGYPAIVEADVLVRDREHIIVEVKSSVGKGDIAELYRIGKLYEKVEKVKPKLAIIGGFIDPEARELAEKLNIEIKPIVKQ